MKKIVILPLDERPCNYNFPLFLSEGNSRYVLAAPPREMMGKKKIPGNYSALKEFLQRECSDAYGLILSVDALLYGGIVPSRLHGLSEEQLTDRLSVIEELKRKNPDLKIYAFALLMRCPSYSSSDEEPDYYAECGREIFLTGQAEHKYIDGLLDKKEYIRQREALDRITGNALKDYLSRRKVNLRLLEKTLMLVGGAIDKLIIPQDDSAPYGYTALDQRKIKSFIAENQIRKVAIYPGTDETGMTLLAALVSDMEEKRPVICPIYPKEECKGVIPLYEDRAVEQSIRAQIEGAGAIMSENSDTADILLFCNLPAGNMKNASEYGGSDYDSRDLPRFTEEMKKGFCEGKIVAAADLAYCNGGDAEWAELLDKSVGLFELGGYAGWNTSSNSLGTVICQSVLRFLYGNGDALKAFTAERIYEDVGYCAYVRKRMCDEVLPKMGLDYFHADGVRGEVSRAVKKMLEDYIKKRFPDVWENYEITDCAMPWNRMFEVELRVEKRLK